ncbi:tetratricopeptide repeat protein [Amycolatopsis cynarae]|uniref:Tetratricopeptide repeat protein n=1 Tax=Amycolatopsis cynarae TaxID=2995223 RepID=A0ABY7B8J1_9PSEU|nr:tetratricopeptide repeat protein [Amycolatopsis sp. HUAS 11-8]WAL67058.1 tetratricopeptide repeat protein [Amycolatopsis sp. HUAS 11-8]
MNPDNPVVALCAQGMAAEARGDAALARDLFRRAWDAATDDYESCVAAHYLARQQDSPEETLRWNRISLQAADRIGDERVRAFYPSLHGNMGRAYAELGDPERARRHYEQAAQRLGDLPPGQYGDWVRHWIAGALREFRGHDELSERVRALLNAFCARQDLRALALLLDPYLSDLGTAADRERLGTALRMLHAGKRLPEQEEIQRAIAALP